MVCKGGFQVQVWSHQKEDYDQLGDVCCGQVIGRWQLLDCIFIDHERSGIWSRSLDVSAVCSLE